MILMWENKLLIFFLLVTQKYSCITFLSNLRFIIPKKLIYLTFPYLGLVYEPTLRILSSLAQITFLTVHLFSPNLNPLWFSKNNLQTITQTCLIFVKFCVFISRKAVMLFSSYTNHSLLSLRSILMISRKFSWLLGFLT